MPECNHADNDYTRDPRALSDRELLIRIDERQREDRDRNNREHQQFLNTLKNITEKVDKNSLFRERSLAIFTTISVIVTFIFNYLLK